MSSFQTFETLIDVVHVEKWSIGITSADASPFLIIAILLAVLSFLP